jgi:flagella basal body P-ring formation protein FlgA
MIVSRSHSVHYALSMLAVILLVSWSPLHADTNSGLTIDLLSEAAVDGSTFTLGQIARITVVDNGPYAELADLVIGESPEPGRVQWLHRQQIETCLKSHGVDQSAYTLNASGPLKLMRNYEDLTATRVCAAVRAYVMEASPWDKNQIKIRSLTYSQSHQLPTGNVDLRVSAPKHSDWMGAIPFNVDVYVDGRMEKRLTVSAHIEVWGDVVVSAKPIGRNQPITAADIKIEKVNLSRAPADAVLRSENVIGLRTKRAVAINTILCSDQVVMPPVIRKGDVIQIVAETAALKLTTQGVAKEDGGIGERIRIVNTNSSKVIYARIMDAHTVSVQF